LLTIQARRKIQSWTVSGSTHSEANIAALTWCSDRQRLGRLAPSLGSDRTAGKPRPQATSSEAARRATAVSEATQTTPGKILTKSRRRARLRAKSAKNEDLSVRSERMRGGPIKIDIVRAQQNAVAIMRKTLERCPFVGSRVAARRSAGAQFASLR
jgi:hypothetical protein